ncbi:hypothetical protein LOZ80_10705 [Paenibacillus sp. HWE-109]|uniref:hypothetical protein n=1 Tax=Paenibacillus sp. HWE-109 TaxID=1306526 RepID=UPI001EDE8EE5|nr:hypothetical protein [Paenibacillus sp. HWE-109]UKS29368.1 hypothetical protein LOZ80_10705 [Paenibacillus sp. HWE-109]
MATYWRIWGGTTSSTISSLRLKQVLGVGFFFVVLKKCNISADEGTPNQLDQHPWFQVTTIAASAGSAGKTYEECSTC